LRIAGFGPVIGQIDFLWKKFFNDPGRQMIFPRNRFHFAPNKQRSRKKIIKIFLLILWLVSVLAGGLWFIQKGLKFFPSTDAAEQKTLLDLWNSKSYLEIVRYTENVLKKKPMDPYSLVFQGFAYFYAGVNQTTVEEKISFMDRTIIALRRAKLNEQLPLKGEVDYILGKAYYHKGVHFADLSAKYMLEAIDGRYIGQDSYEYLGLSYSVIGEYSESLKYFLKAIESNPTDLLFLTVAQTYYQLGDKVAAEEYLMRAVNKSTDPALTQKARFLLGDIYFQNKEYIKSEEQYVKILENNPQSPDAYFFLGEIYHALGDTVKARASWRRTLRIDPNYFGALRRLYN
jgi:tetratricopeptide (TPR) repeat protein